MKKSSILKITTLFIFLLGFAVLFTSAKKNNRKTNARLNEVVVYTYDSFVSEWGPGPEIEKLFEEKTGYDLTFVDCGGGVQVLSRAVLEKKNVRADVILGLDNIIAQKAIDEKILSKYKPKNAANVIPQDAVNELSKDWYLTPFDYSHFAMIYDTQSDVPCPASLEDLTNPVYAKKLF